ncbi:MAG: PKD domain-containing protein [Acidimicrobiales bacterium]
MSSDIEVNPQTLGLTGLASWFWLSNPTTSLPPLTVSIAGYSVIASAAIASYTWTFGDGDSATAYGPGSQAEPAASYTYQQKGAYQVSVIAHYVGSYTFAGNGLTPQTAPLNVDVTMGTLTYGVQEARSVLVDPGSQNQ